MMRAQDADRAKMLINDRRRISIAKWNLVAHFARGERGGDFWHAQLFDEQLAQAVEEFRQRKIEEIDRQLRELGVEPPEGPE